MSAQFYRLRRGDTLGELAQRFGTTVAELCRINAIETPDKIAAGDVIALKATAVCKVRVLLIDWDRNPIPEAKVRLEYSGKRKMLTSRRNGCLPEIITQGPEDLIDVSIMRLDRTWKKIAQVASGWGNKLVTLRSPKLKVTSETKLHPKDEFGKPKPDPATRKKTPLPTFSPRFTIAEGKLQADYGDGKGIKTKEVTNPGSLLFNKVTADQAELDFLKCYKGDKITKADYDAAAKKLGIEVEVIIAIERQESKGQAYDKLKRPVILYERHHFSRLTKRKYDERNSDISCPRAYTFAVKMGDGTRIPEEDRYSSYSSQYARLAKAYNLDKEAALMSCSWGKYQIMGFNHKACGYHNVQDFVAMMCESERKQLDALVEYIEKNCLKAAREKDWKAIASAYNGPKYWKNSYDRQLKEKYDQLIAARR